MISLILLYLASIPAGTTTGLNFKIYQEFNSFSSPIPSWVKLTTTSHLHYSVKTSQLVFLFLPLPFFIHSQHNTAAREILLEPESGSVTILFKTCPCPHLTRRKSHSHEDKALLIYHLNTSLTCFLPATSTHSIPATLASLLLCQNRHSCLCLQALYPEICVIHSFISFIQMSLNSDHPSFLFVFSLFFLH